MIQRRVMFAGRVQGVGFRYTACHIAGNFQVRGYVRNLTDGRVEAVVEGEEPEIERFLAALTQEMSRNIRDSSWGDFEATGEFAGFDIRY